MPLMHSKSKKAFSKNVETEMKSGKPKDQSIAIAYSIKRKPKKMASGGKPEEAHESTTRPDGGYGSVTVIDAKGGEVKRMAAGGPVSAKKEKRPMPETEGEDSHQIARNGAKHALSPEADFQTEHRPMPKKGMRTTPIKHPSMAQSPVFKTKMRDQEDHLQTSAGVNDGPQEQPPKDDDEIGPDRSGPTTPSLKMKRMAKGGMINEEVSMHDAEEDEVEHPAGLESDNDEMKPPEDEFMTGHFAEGGEIDPMDEEMEEHHASISAAIMAKRAKLHEMVASGAMDEDNAAESMMADGGQVDLDENAMEEPNGYYERNEHAALKENYDEGMHDATDPMDSNEHGDEREASAENKRDMVSAIRSRMRKRRS